MVLVNDGYVVNVILLKTVRKLATKKADLIPTMEGVRAYDGTRRKVFGLTTLTIVTGPLEQQVNFQVVDIEAFFNMLLGRPWIHATKAVTSTLHQKIRHLNNKEIISITLKDNQFAPTALISDADLAKIVQGWRKTFKGTDHQGRILKITTEEGPMFKDGSGDESESAFDNESESEPVLVSNVPNTPVKTPFSLFYDKLGSVPEVVPQTNKVPFTLFYHNLGAILENESKIVTHTPAKSKNMELILRATSSTTSPLTPDEMFVLPELFAQIDLIDAKFSYDSSHFNCNAILNEHEEFDLSDYPPHLAKELDKRELGTPIIEETKPINVGIDQTPQELKIGITLDPMERQQFTDLLLEYKDVFAWSYKDMPRIVREITEHKIPIKPGAKPVK
ncbi:uncharacterized protein LOC141630815 [Silene latifolia]|uniref:uncharacterized protein LOC141630815 n=1 Tax=Silene latifolia TaxID=37657 RepID=UPI003D76BC1E